MYALYFIVAIAIFNYAWIRKREDIFDPFFLYCAVVLGFFFSDFVISGYSDRIVGDLPIKVAQSYQLLLLVTCILSVLGALLVDHLWFRGRSHCEGAEAPSPGQQQIYFWVAALLLVLELVKRLVSANWSSEIFLQGTLSGYGYAAWRGGVGELGNLGDGTFLYALLTSLLPIAGILFGYVAICRGALTRRNAAVVGLLATMALLILNGGRLPLLAVGIFIGAQLWQTSKTRRHRLFVATSIAIALAAATSVMYLNRAGGFASLVYGSSSQFAFIYNQDDNYYQILKSMDIAESTGEQWDPVVFAYAILVNPIPRYYWAAKPALTQQFWGHYKNEWTTISMVGEYAAMFGVAGSVAATIFTGVLSFVLIRIGDLSRRQPGGTILVVSLVFYVYMVHRSLLNITQALYPVAFLAAVHWFSLKCADRRPSNEKATSTGRRQIRW